MKTLVKELPIMMNSSLNLAQLFIAVLFVECYALHENGQSILKSEITWEAITIKPIYLFLYFVACFKIFWFAVTLSKSYLMTKPNQFALELNPKVSFTFFLLLFLTGSYSYFLIATPTISPFYSEKGGLFHLLYLLPFALTFSVSVWVLFFSRVNFHEKGSND